MSGIFGVLRRDGGSIPTEFGASMDRIMRPALGLTSQVWNEGGCLLGRAWWPAGRNGGQNSEAPNLHESRLTRRFIADARLDGKADLCRALSLPSAAATSWPDEELVARAHLRWGNSCFERLLGDWVMAAWDPAVRDLTIARESLGMSPLYFYENRHWVVFASRIAAILTLPMVPRAVDDEYLAEMLISAGGLEDHTAFASVKWVRPAHFIRFSQTGSRSTRYWVFTPQEDIMRLTQREAAEGLVEVLGAAVRDRISDQPRIGLALSGGLDSGSVAALAAEVVSHTGQEIHAFTHVPFFADYDCGGKVGNEGPYAAETARTLGLSRVVKFDSAGKSPVAAIRDAVELSNGIRFGAVNALFILDLVDRCTAVGSDILLIAQAGNDTISWFGPDSVRHRGLAWIGLIRRRLAARLGSALPDLRTGGGRAAYLAKRVALMTPQFIRRLGVTSRIGELGSSRQGSIEQMPIDNWSELATGRPLRIADPTLDRRVAAFCWSLDEKHYLGPNGEKRWLIRSAMTSFLPPTVLRGEGKGRQSADMIMRLRAVGPEVESLLALFASDATVSSYLDIQTMRRCWARVQVENTDDSRRSAGSVLCLGVKIGCFLLSADARSVQV